MSKKQHLDEFLREKLSELPNENPGGFHKVESGMKGRKQKGMAAVMMLPLLIVGLYWLSLFTEKDLLIYPKKQPVPAAQGATPDSQMSKTAIENNAVLDENADLETSKSEAVAGEETASETPQKTLSVQEAAFASEKKGGESKAVVKAEAAKKQTLNQPAEPKHLIAASGAKPATNAGQKSNTSNNQNPVYVLESSSVQSKPMAAVNVNPNTASANTLVGFFRDGDEEDYEEVFDILETDVRELSDWSLTLNIYPNYTFREFKINQNFSKKVNPRYEGIINESEKGGFAFNVGADLRYHLGDNLFLGTGLAFIQTKINGTYEFEISDEPVLDNSGNIEMYAQFIEPIKINQGIIQTYQFLQVPLHVSYQPWASEKIRLIIEGGFSFIRFLRAEGQTIDYVNLLPKDLQTMHFNSTMASLDFKIGMTYYPTPLVGIGVEPTITYFNSSLYPENSPVYVIPWSVGVNLNLKFRIL